MAIVTTLTVINGTTTAGGTDAYVDPNGYFTVTVPGSTASAKARSISDVQIQPYVAAVSQVSTVTIATVADNSMYSLSVNCQDTISGVITSVPLTVTSGTGATAATIAAQFVAALSGISSTLSVTGSVDGSNRFAVTAASAFPVFSITSGDNKLTVNPVDGTNGTTVGVVGVGLGTQLQAIYPRNTGFYSAGGFTAAATIVSATHYTTVKVVSGTQEFVVLVDESATNVNDLIGSYGTLTALKAGQRAIIGARTVTPDAAITVTTGAIALTGTGGTFSAFDLRAGDFILPGANYAAEVISRILITTSDTAGIGTYKTAESAAVFRPVQWRTLPI